MNFKQGLRKCFSLSSSKTGGIGEPRSLRVKEKLSSAESSSVDALP